MNTLVNEETVRMQMQTFRGERGPVGPAGPQGEKGERGAVGAQGPQGERGETGPKGDKGDTGERGAAGAQGPQGERGETGPKGDKGDAGERGPEGPQGEMGLQGPQGETGPAGPAPTDEQTQAALGAWLAEHPVPTTVKDVWVDLGSVTVNEGEEPVILGWPLAGKIKKFCIWGTTKAHSGTANLSIIPRGTAATNTGGPFFSNVGSWGTDASLTYYYSVYAEKIKNGRSNQYAWWGVGGCSQFDNLGTSFLAPVDFGGADPSANLYIAAYWINAVFPVGASFRAWVVYE